MTRALIAILVVAAWMTPCRANETRYPDDDNFGHSMQSDRGNPFGTDNDWSYDHRDLSAPAKDALTSRPLPPQPATAASVAAIRRATHTLTYILVGVAVAVGGILAGLGMWLGAVAQEQKENALRVNSLLARAHEDTDRPGIATSTPERTIPRRRALSRASRKLPQIEFAEGVIRKMADGINAFRKRRHGVETGFALVGNIVGSGATRKIVVRGLVDAGPGTECSAGHVDFDRDYQTREIEKLRLIDWEVSHIGDAHLHPGAMDHCSGGDYQTDRANVLASNSQEMVFVIATDARAHRGGQVRGSMYVGGLKLDFFYMGVDSNSEYRAFLPTIAYGVAALEVDDSLERFHDSDPVRVVLDFDNLRRLAGYSYRFTLCPMGDGHAGPCVEMTHKRLGFKLLILFGDSAFERPEVYVQIGEKIVQYDSEYIKSTPVEHLCFTQIALAAERDVRTLSTQNTMTDGKTPADAEPASAATA